MAFARAHIDFSICNPEREGRLVASAYYMIKNRPEISLQCKIVDHEPCAVLRWHEVHAVKLTGPPFLRFLKGLGDAQLAIDEYDRCLTGESGRVPPFPVLKENFVMRRLRLLFATPPPVVLGDCRYSDSDGGVSSISFARAQKIFGRLTLVGAGTWSSIDLGNDAGYRSFIQAVKDMHDALKSLDE